MQERIEQQSQALTEAATYVRSGGELIYVTCSVLPEENDRQIEAFTAAHPQFSPMPMLERWTGLFGASVAKPISANGKSLTLSPAATDTDGFFFCRMVKA